MKRLNQVHRGIEKTTDVLSFPIYGSVGEIPADREYLLGDIVINVRAAQKQAPEYGLSLDSEIRRLLIHGFLHLLGFDHEIGRYQERKMRIRETELNNALQALD